MVLTGPGGTGALDADGRPVDGARELARIPARALASEAIVFDRESRAPARRRAAPAPGAPAEPVDTLPLRGQDPGAVLTALLGSPNLASRHPVYEQYDSNVQSNTVAAPGRGAAVLRIKGTTKALVATTDGNAPVGVLDPWLGAALSVAEAARNVSITGARPLGVTNCLNYGDPTRPEAFWQLAEGVRGLGDACRALGLPVTGGNVSLYNEAPGSAIAPTPEIGIVGLLDDVANARRAGASAGDGNLIVLVGEAAPGLAGSEYERLAGAAPEDGPPALDLDRERRLQAFIREAIARGLVESCQDVSGGGLAVAVAEQAHLGRARAHGSGCRSATLRRSRCSARARRGSSCEALAAARPGASSCWPASTASRSRRSGRRAATRLVIELTGGRGATGAAEERGSGIADALDVAGRGPAARLGARAVAGARLGRGGRPADVRRRRGGAAGSRPRGRGSRRDRAVRAPAPRPGVGGRRRRRRRPADDLQGPRDGRPGARRAADPVARGRARRRALPLLDDRLDDLGERPARRSASGRGGRSPSATTATSSTPASCSTQLAGGRGRLPASTDTELLTALLADEPAADTVDALRQVLPRVRGAYSLVILDERAGDRRARPVRVPAAGPGPDPAARAREPGLWGDDTAGWILASETAALDIVGAEFVRDVEPGEIVVLEPGREPVSRPLRRGDARPVRVRADLLRPAGLVHGGAQPVRGPAPDGDAARAASTRSRPTS